MSVLHRHDAQYDERNLFLQVTLGLVSACRRVEDVVRQHGARTAAPPGPDDAFFYAVLGVIAVTRRTMHHVEHALATARPPASRAEPSPSGPRGLLD